MGVEREMVKKKAGEMKRSLRCGLLIVFILKNAAVLREIPWREEMWGKAETMQNAPVIFVPRHHFEHEFTGKSFSQRTSPHPAFTQAVVVSLCYELIETWIQNPKIIA